MARQTVERFLETVQRSGLVQRDQLGRVIAALKESRPNGKLDDVDRVVERLIEEKLLTRWQADKLLDGKARGFFLGQYRLLDHLGSGGMSSVYLAEHTLMKRQVAIKVLPAKRVEDSSYLARFHREAEAAASLDHRNIVRAYDIDNDGTTHYMALEYVQGRDLQRIVKDDGPLEYAAAADYTRQAADGLQHAHEAGLIHRDVKPANLLVDQQGVVKVLDLGLARFTADEEASLTIAYDENVLGTADYLAPEQAIDSHSVDARADIYSLGCTLYFLLVGQPPFPDGTLPQRLLKHQKSPPPSIYERRQDVPDDLVAICLRMMAKRAGERFQSAGKVAEALGAWLDTHRRTETGERAAGASKQPKAGSSSGKQHSVAKGSSTKGRAGVAVARTDKTPLPKHRDQETAAETDKLKQSGERTVTVRGRRNDSKENLLRAKPLDDKPALSEFIDPSDSPIRERMRPKTPMTQEEFEAYQERRQKLPIGIWISIIVGTVLILLLALLVLLR